MIEQNRFFIDGRWVAPREPASLEVINPATEEVAGHISLGTREDVDDAVSAARRAFPGWSATSRQERHALLLRIIAEYEARYDEMARLITIEMGAPAWLSREVQAAMGLAHLKVAAEALETFSFEERAGPTLIVREPIGVCAFITPWNWPVNQISSKVAPALATGCTMVLKPSEVAPFSAGLWAEILEAAGVPNGIFNLVNGLGPVVGAALAEHPEVDMVSFTGSTRAGVEVARAAAATVKRVHQELGGKSPNIILPDAPFEEAVRTGVWNVMKNTGQTCNAPTRMLVPHARLAEAAGIAKTAALALSVGDPTGNVEIGPLVSKIQWDRVQGFIQAGIAEGAELVAGGAGRPEGLERGYFVKPTVFSGVTEDMTIAREEIFGPVVSIMAYEDVEDAVRIANDTPYGLAAFVQGGDLEQARQVAARLRAGQVNINNAAPDLTAPFGGYKQSGNGREWGAFAFHDFLEVKAVLGHEPAVEAA